MHIWLQIKILDDIALKDIYSKHPWALVIWFAPLFWRAAHLKWCCCYGSWSGWMPGCGCSPPFEYQLYKYLRIKDSFKIFTSPFPRVESSLESFQVESEVKSKVYINVTRVRLMFESLTREHISGANATQNARERAVVTFGIILHCFTLMVLTVVF